MLKINNVEIEGKYNKTEKLLIQMLTEDTGRNILDSGDFYGRNWEQNRKIKNWNELPFVEFEISETGIITHLNTYQTLREQLYYSKDAKKLDKEFHKFSSSEEYKDESWLTCMEDFVNKHLKVPKDDWTTINTYNYENNLSIVLQYVSFYYKSTQFILLQTHNGCDVRGGYSTPHIFESENEIITDACEFELMCECGNEYCNYLGYFENNKDFKIIDEKHIICNNCKKIVWTNPNES